MSDGKATPTLDVDAIAARADAATPGPWQITDRNGDHVRRNLRGAGDRMVLGLAALLWPDPADETFLTHAREDVPALVAAVVEARETAVWAQLAADTQKERADKLHDAVSKAPHDEGCATEWAGLVDDPEDARCTCWKDGL